MTKIYLYILFALMPTFLLKAGDLPQAWSKPELIVPLISEFDDFAPTYNHFDGKLYFSSKRSGKSQLYWTQLENDEYAKPLLMKGLINSNSENRSYFSFSNDGTVYLSAFRKTKKYPFLNIAQSIIMRNAYSEPAFVESLIHDSFSGQSAISPNGLVMVFASDRINRKTTDLFITYRQESGLWSEPIELTELNSDGNEITPYFFSDSLLFFSSDGLSGIGGYDVYKSELFNGQWQRPIPLNDINTEYDESDMIILPSGEAIFSSNRSGKSNLDLYSAKPIEINEKHESDNYYFTLKSSPQEIRLKQDIKYILINLNGTYPIEYDYFKVCDSLFSIANGLEFDFLINSPIDFLFHLKFEQAKLERSNIIIAVNSNNLNSEFTDRIFRLADFLNFPSDKIEIKQDETIDNNYFSIETVNPLTQLSKSNISFYSSNLQIIADCEPQPNDFVLNIRTDKSESQDNIVSSKDCHFPFKHELKLSSLSDAIQNSSKDELSLFADINIANSEMGKLSVYLNLPIISNLSKEPFSITNKGKKQFVYFLKLPNGDKKSLEELNKSILEMLSENINIAKSIQYFKTSGSYSNDIFLKDLNILLKNRKNIQITELSASLIKYQLSNYAILIVEI